jgi:hypothetical protein
MAEAGTAELNRYLNADRDVIQLHAVMHGESIALPDEGIKFFLSCDVLRESGKHAQYDMIVLKPPNDVAYQLLLAEGVKWPEPKTRRRLL